MNPLLSVAIPTKDRYITLLPVLTGLVKDFECLDIEFVIQDNTCNNEPILKYLSEINNNKIKYFHVSNQISVTENCDNSIKNSNGKYLILIGDDDYVLPDIIEVVNWMEENNVECLNSNTATYFWPDLTFKYQTKVSNSASLIISKPIGKTYTKLDASAELKKVIKSGATDFANLPRLYHGIVKRDVLELIYSKCHTYFPGPSPDMANSSALAIFTKNFHLFHFPFSISGKSILSTSGMGLNHTHVGDLENKPFLDKNLIRQWDKKIPYFWSGDTIYAQSLSHSLKACNYNSRLNYNQLYAHLLVFERKTVFKKIDPIIDALKTNPFNLLTVLFWVFIYSKNRGVNFIMRKLYSQKKYLTFRDIKKIEDCVNLIGNIDC